MENFAPREEILKIINQIDNIQNYETALLNPTPSINFIRTQVKLYNMFEQSNPEPEKLEEFRSTIYEKCPMAGMIIDGKKFKLNHSMQKQEQQSNYK